MKTSFLILVFVSLQLSSYSQNNEIMYLWPESVPGETGEKHPPVQTDNTSGNTIRLTDITNPALIVYESEKSKNNGIGVIVSPGGAYRHLAIDKEGYEIAEWLNELGFTAFVLQYRVPDKRDGALQDIQRSIRIIKSKATEWNIQEDKIGLIGFSAGASLSARVSAWDGKISYPPVDRKDSISLNVSFNLLIYPGGLDDGPDGNLSSDLNISEKTPPMFIFSTADDRLAKSAIVMSNALLDNDIPMELHILPTGGHGYGMRPGNIAGETWPKLAEMWLQNMVKD